MVEKIYDLRDKEIVQSIPKLLNSQLKKEFPGSKIVIRSDGYVIVDSDLSDAEIKTKIEKCLQ